MHVVDLTYPIGPGMSCYPGTPSPQSSVLCSIEEQGYSERQLSFSSHTGTHVDLPLHMLSGGISLDSFPPEQFMGPAAVIDLKGFSGTVISPDLLLRFGQLVGRCEFVLINSGWGRYWGSDAYLSGYPVLSEAAADWFAGFRLKGVGMDMVSFDHADSSDYPVHRRFLEKGLLLFENLCSLEKLPEGIFHFIALPLKLQGAEASPVRAIALTGEG